MLHVSLLGRFLIRCDGHIVRGLEARRPQELLAYLLIYRDKAHQREQLADLLWGDDAGGAARKGLRQALWQIQAAFEGEEPDEPPLLLTNQEWLQINPARKLWTDIAVFEEVLRAYGGQSGEHLMAAEADKLDRAVSYYHGDLLEGCYADWCLFERERLQNLFLISLDKLMAYCEANGCHESGLRYGSLILGRDCAHERTHRRMMRLYYLAGDRTTALRQYERCVETLRRELNVAPAASTTALQERIRSDSLAPAQTGRPGASELLHELRALRGTLATVQQHLDQQIAAFSSAVGEEQP